MSTFKNVKRRLKDASSRRGVVTLEYVMVLAVVFPATYAMLLLAARGLAALYCFVSIALGGLNL